MTKNTVTITDATCLDLSPISLAVCVLPAGHDRLLFKRNASAQEMEMALHCSADGRQWA